MAFISLAEFLNLADPLDTKYFRSHWRIIPRAENWTKYYELAKENFEKYGEAGPPVGCRVITLQPGHGGSPGQRRTFDGVFPRDERCFQIYYIDEHYQKGEKQLSLVARSLWWAEIAVIDEASYDWREWKWLSGN